MGGLWPSEQGEGFQSHTTFSACFSQAFPAAIFTRPEHTEGVQEGRGRV